MIERKNKQIKESKKETNETANKKELKRTNK